MTGLRTGAWRTLPQRSASRLPPPVTHVDVPCPDGTRETSTSSLWHPNPSCQSPHEEITQPHRGTRHLPGRRPKCPGHEDQGRTELLPQIPECRLGLRLIRSKAAGTGKGHARGRRGHRMEGSYPVMGVPVSEAPCRTVVTCEAPVGKPAREMGHAVLFLPPV